jgi:hypothetical protein
MMWTRRVKGTCCSAWPYALRAVGSRWAVGGQSVGSPWASMAHAQAPVPRSKSLPPERGAPARREADAERGEQPEPRQAERRQRGARRSGDDGANQVAAREERAQRAAARHRGGAAARRRGGAAAPAAGSGGGATAGRAGSPGALFCLRWRLQGPLPMGPRLTRGSRRAAYFSEFFEGMHCEWDGFCVLGARGAGHALCPRRRAGVGPRARRCPCTAAPRSMSRRGGAAVASRPSHASLLTCSAPAGPGFDLRV